MNKNTSSLMLLDNFFLGGGCLDLCQKGFTEATNICGHVEASGTGRKKKNAADFGVSESLF